MTACNNCAGLGVITRCRCGEMCVCLHFDFGQVCSQGISIECPHCEGTRNAKLSNDSGEPSEDGRMQATPVR